MSMKTGDDKSQLFAEFLKSEKYMSCKAKQCGENNLLSRSAACFLVDWLVSNDVKVLAIDFDLTLSTIHSGGVFDPVVDTANPDSCIYKLSKDMDEVAHYAKARGLKIVCVTFSDKETTRRTIRKGVGLIGGEELVNLTLKTSQAKFCFDKIYAFYPRNYRTAEECRCLGIKHPMPHNKSYHLGKVCEDFKVSPPQIVLIDDDDKNCVNACQDGYLTISFAPKAGYSQAGIYTRTRVPCT